MEQEIRSLLYEMALGIADTAEQVAYLMESTAKSLPADRAQELLADAVKIRARQNVIRALLEQAFPPIPDRGQS